MMERVALSAGRCGPECVEYSTDIVEIQAGTYYVKETEAPKGFNLSTARNNHCGRTDSSNGLLIRGGLHADETQF